MTNDSENQMDTTNDVVPPPAAKPKRERKSAKKAAASKKSVATKKPAKTGRRGKPERTELKVNEMSADETKLLKALWADKGPREGKPLHELQKQLWPKVKGTSKVRNTLRRLVKFGWLELQEPTQQEIAAHEKAGKGRLYSKYRLTEKGRKRGLS